MVVVEKENLDLEFEKEGGNDGRVSDKRLVDEGRRNPKSNSKFTSKVTPIT